MDKHHIVPRYMGGSNRADNIVEITRTCHVMWHYANWRLWGNKEDYIAYKGLSGCIAGEEMHKEKSSLAGTKSVINKTGVHSLTLEQRKEYGREGGAKGGRQMANYKWITDGVQNSRIPNHMKVPPGWKLGVTRKKPRKHQPKYGTRQDWNDVQRLKSQVIKEKRRQDLVSLNLNQRGSIAMLSRLWGISHSQVRRYLNKIGVQGIEP